MNGKYVILIPDGLAGLPLKELDNQTVLQAASTPHLDSLASQGWVGRSHNVPEDLPPGSDVATLGLLGYSPLKYYTGRAPLEVAAQGIPLNAEDWAFRCNLVCLENGLMKSFTAGHISSPEAAELLQTVQQKVAPLWNDILKKTSLFPNQQGGKIEFYPGVSYRNIMIVRPESDSLPHSSLFSEKTETFPPHDFTDQEFAQALPRGEGSSILRELMREIADIFAMHPINLKRIQEGKLPATHAWLWGQGKRPALQPFAERHRGIRGAMITAVDLLKGIAANIGWDQINVPNITGYIDTDFAAKGQYAAQALDQYDLVCVHIEATDESGHEGSLEKKRASIEKIDRETLPPILEKLRSFDQWRILISPDHPTPVALKTHTRDYVPWIIAGSDIHTNNKRQQYNEITAKKSSLCFENGWNLIDLFLLDQ
ncbi:MAG: cofactor-independent phosphoglycerate mutase [Planctomycetia bacterium]|nr:cofactor-independent phosphoglycerate mutase [Planctomycetia bacterium]